MSEALKKEEDRTFITEDREQPIPPENVVAYNELRSCLPREGHSSNGRNGDGS